MFAVLATLWLTACDGGDSGSHSESAAATSAMPQRMQKDEDKDEMGDKAVNDASDSLDQAAEALNDMPSKKSVFNIIKQWSWVF